MGHGKAGQVAVIFISQRTDDDAQDYGAAAEEMVMLAARQPGYAGVRSVRDAAGLGITISYWEDEASAKAWRDHPRHCQIREQGRGRWYEHYHIDVARITRSYGWSRDAV